MQLTQGLQPIKDQGEEFLFEAVLNALAKALKAMSFYPQDHPLREESISSVVLQLKPLLKEQALILLWSRDACTVTERTPLRSTSITAKALAREMLTRKLQRLIILPEISLKDLKAFLAIVTADAAGIYAAGGIEVEMLRAGITSIGANEVDLSLLTGVQAEEVVTETEEDSAEPTDSGDSLQAETTEENEESQVVEDAMDIQFSLLGMDIILGMLKAEKKESQFLQLAREVIDAAEVLKRQRAFEELMPVIAVLLDVLSMESRPVTQKEFIRYALEQISSGAMTAYLLDKIEERSQENEIMLDRLCESIGQALAYPLIQRLCVAESLHARKTIAIALTRSGEVAIPALIPMLKDERWYVVRNIVTILGEIGSIAAVSALQQTIGHPESKVRKEIIRSFLKISPVSVEQTLISLIGDADKDVVRQTIHALGIIRSKTAVRPLLEIISAQDVFLKELNLKKWALAALGRIGDRQATATLLAVIDSRGWFAPGRWQELKIAAAVALGHLGDETAFPLLKKFARRNTPLGSACCDAVDNLERLVK